METTTEHRGISKHKAIVSAVSEIAALPSPQQAINRLADALSCPIAIVANGRKVCSAGAKQLLEVSPESLGAFQSIEISGNEDMGTSPKQMLMTGHGMGAVIPFHSHIDQALGWLVVGRRAQDEANRPFDFRSVENLFEKLGDQFLERLTSMREQTEKVEANLHALRQRIAELELDNRTLRTIFDTQELVKSKLTTNEADDERNEVLSALESGASLDSLTAKYEGSLIKWALKQCRGNKARAARLLKVRPNTFHYKILRRNIDGE